MEILKINKDKVVLKFTNDEALLLCSSLNEICNGIEVPEFDKRIGVPREEARKILEFINSSYRKIENEA